MFWNFGLGQNAFLTAGLFGAATLLIDRRPVVAGLLFGALCYKPQFGMMIPLALAAAGQWRAFAAAAASAVALVLASSRCSASRPGRLCTPPAPRPTMYQSGRILFAGMANVFGGARALGAEPPVAYALQAVATLLPPGWSWRRGVPACRCRPAPRCWPRRRWSRRRWRCSTT